MMFNATPTEIPRKLGPVDWNIDGEGGIHSGSLYSSGTAGGSGGSGSVLGLTSLSKSSKSASINSLSMEEVKATKFTLEAFEAVPDDVSNKKEVSKVEMTGSGTLEASAGTDEPLLSLKLGKRMYFEDVCAGSNAKNASQSAILAPSPTLIKRSKSHSQSKHVPRCQVEGCNLDLSSAKGYHRKHRVCESHSKSPKVIIGDLERRFCQQCSRFHGLLEFDETKRSCRRRLSDHNARRRKPQTEAIHFNAARLSSSSYDGKQQMGFQWNEVSFLHAKPNVKFSWEGALDFKFPQIKGFTRAKVGNANGHLQLPGNSPTKGKHSTAEVLNQGVEESTVTMNMCTSRMPDLHHGALSLLSNDLWASCDPKQGSLSYSTLAYSTGMSQPAMNALSQRFRPTLSENWQMEQQTRDSFSLVHDTTLSGEGGNHFQEYQLLKSPYDSGFYSNQMN